MNIVPPTGSSAQTINPTAQLTATFGWLVSALAGISLVLVVWNFVSPGQLPGTAGWPEALLVLTTAIATLVSLSRELPGQNVILAAAVIGFIGGTAHALSATTAIPFGPLHFTVSAGPKVLGLVPWPVPAIWIIAILNSRGVARLILRPWQKRRTYGFWLIGGTAVLTVSFAAALDPFVAQVKGYWLWQPTKALFAWHGAPLANFWGRLAITLLIMAFATPALINKQPRLRKSPPDYHPLAIWLLALALFATAAVVHKLWPATGFCILTGALVGGFAIRGAHWKARGVGKDPTT